jgi:hypothetical protein
MDLAAALNSGFQQAIEEFRQAARDDPGLQKLVDQLPEDVALEYGVRAGRAATAPLIWANAVGDRMSIKPVTEFLGVSRQNVYKRVANGSMLGLPGQGTTWFPQWQFDHSSVDGPGKGVVRPAVAAIVRAFREADDEVEALVIAAWAMKPNDLLGGQSPALWLVEQDDAERVVKAARRAAQGPAA